MRQRQAAVAVELPRTGPVGVEPADEDDRAPRLGLGQRGEQGPVDPVAQRADEAEQGSRQVGDRRRARGRGGRAGVGESDDVGAPCGRWRILAGRLGDGLAELLGTEAADADGQVGLAHGLAFEPVDRRRPGAASIASSRRC